MKLVLASDAATALGVSLRRMHDLLKAKRIPGAVKIGEGRGGVWQVPVDEKTGRPHVRPGSRGPKARWRIYERSE